MVLASLNCDTQHVCFGSMRLGNCHCSGLQEDDHAVSSLIIAPCTARTRLVGMIFDAAVSNCLSPRSTRSSSLAARPPTSSSLRITDRFFRYASPCLGNQFSPSTSLQSISDLPVHSPTIFSHSVNSPLLPSITPSLFHSRLKTYLFHKSFPR